MDRCICHPFALFLAENRKGTCTSHLSSHRHGYWGLLWQHVLCFEKPLGVVLCKKSYLVIQNLLLVKREYQSIKCARKPRSLVRIGRPDEPLRRVTTVAWA